MNTDIMLIGLNIYDLLWIFAFWQAWMLVGAIVLSALPIRDEDMESLDFIIIVNVFPAVLALNLMLWIQGRFGD